MNHKRTKPRKYRGHCHFCKYYKDLGNSKNAKHISRLRDDLRVKEETKL